MLQFAAVFGALSVAWPYYLLRQQPLPWFDSALLIGALAFVLATLTRQYWWWRIIHALFAPAAAIVYRVDIAPHWYLLAFVLTFLVYRGALSNQVPLYLSNRATAGALAGFLSHEPPARFIDLGAGIGTITCSLAEILTGTQVDGIENSYLPWAIGRLRAARRGNCQWFFGNLWQMSLNDYDGAYAFLSPAPMTDVWIKVKREMRPGSWFISNSFPVPGIEAAYVVEVADSRRTRLYCYRV